MIGNSCELRIGQHCHIKDTCFWLEDNESKIIIGDYFSMESGHIASTEGKEIKIGDDCMFSNDVEIRNGDSHSIIKEDTGERINYAENIEIFDHVWLTAHTRILKGASIPSYSIVANTAVVTKKLDEPYSIYGGIPCRLLKKNINWKREKI